MAGRQGPAVPGWGLHPSGTAQGEAGGSSQAISGCSSEGGNSLKRKQPGFATSTSALHLGSLAEELHEAGSLQLKKRCLSAADLPRTGGGPADGPPGELPVSAFGFDPSTASAATVATVATHRLRRCSSQPMHHHPPQQQPQQPHQQHHRYDLRSRRGASSAAVQQENATTFQQSRAPSAELPPQHLGLWLAAGTVQPAAGGLPHQPPPGSAALQQQQRYGLPASASAARETAASLHSGSWQPQHPPAPAQRAEDPHHFVIRAPAAFGAAYAHPPAACLQQHQQHQQRGQQQSHRDGPVAAAAWRRPSRQHAPTPPPPTLPAHEAAGVRPAAGRPAYVAPRAGLPGMLQPGASRPQVWQPQPSHLAQYGAPQQQRQQQQQGFARSFAVQQQQQQRHSRQPFFSLQQPQQPQGPAFNQQQQRSGYARGGAGGYVAGAGGLGRQPAFVDSQEECWEMQRFPAGRPPLPGQAAEQEQPWDDFHVALDDEETDEEGFGEEGLLFGSPIHPSGRRPCSSPYSSRQATGAATFDVPGYDCGQQGHGVDVGEHHGAGGLGTPATAAAPPSEPPPAPLPPARTRSQLVAELAEANAALSQIRAPGGRPFIPVHEADCMMHLCGVYEIPPICLALGASYFQRLLATNPRMEEAAKTASYFVKSTVPGIGGSLGRQVLMMCGNTRHQSLVSLYTACVFLGCKVGHRVQYAGQLTSMLRAVMRDAEGEEIKIKTRDAEQLERVVLQALDWRLGPVFDLNAPGPY